MPVNICRPLGLFRFRAYSDHVGLAFRKSDFGLTFGLVGVAGLAAWQPDSLIGQAAIC